ASPALVHLVASNWAVYWGVAIVGLGIVFTLSSRVDRLDASTASMLFIVYAALNGAMLSLVVIADTGESITTTFIVSSGVFAALAAYGSITKQNLSGLGQFLFMGLVGVVLASIVGVFWHNDAFQFLLSFVGVLLFSGLVAYDAQRLRN